MIDVLREEHNLLRRFAGYLAWDETGGDVAQVRMRGDLLVFFCALRRHAELIRSLFRLTAAPRGRSGAAFQERMRLLHMRSEIVEAFHESSGHSWAPRRILVGELAAALRAHLRWEEENLWPLFGMPRDPSAEAAREKDARARLRVLSAEILAGGVKLLGSSGRGIDAGSPSKEGVRPPGPKRSSKGTGRP